MEKKGKTETNQTSPSRLSSIIKNARDIMRKDKGMNGELDRLPQLTWLMFLKFLDDAEIILETEAKLEGKKYVATIDSPYKWRDWAAKPDGITGDELVSFINNDETTRPDGTKGVGLLTYLRSLEGTNSKNGRNVISSVFRGINNRMLNGYLLRDVINKVNEINFSSSEEIHVLSHLYESLLKELRDAAGDSGEFYTPRPVIKFMVKIIDPRIGEAILDPAAGTGGFLVESFAHLGKYCKTAEDYELLQKKTFFGIEAKSLPYMLCQMNLVLNGLEYPNIDPLNALRIPLREIGDKDRVDIILTNPPFGGEEERGILSNFPDDKKTTETALLFLQLIMRKLRRKIGNNKGGRCGIVLPNGTPLMGGGIPERIRKELLEDFNLHTIIRLPNGVFAPYTTIKTNLLFFEHGGPTKEIWYYELPLREGKKQYSKTKPLRFEEFDPVISWWNNKKENQFAWKISITSIINNGYNLDQRNPNEKNDNEYIPPEDLLKQISAETKEMQKSIDECLIMLDNFQLVHKQELK